MPAATSPVPEGEGDPALTDVFPGPVIEGVTSWKMVTHRLGRDNQLALMRRLWAFRNADRERMPLAAYSWAHELLTRACARSDARPLLPLLRVEADFTIGSHVFFCLHWLEERERLDRLKGYDWIEMRVFRQPARGSKPSRMALKAPIPFRQDGSGEHTTCGLDRDLITSPALIPVNDLTDLVACDLRRDPFLAVWLRNAQRELEQVWDMRPSAFRKILLSGQRRRIPD